MEIADWRDQAREPTPGRTRALGGRKEDQAGRALQAWARLRADGRLPTALVNGELRVERIHSDIDGSPVALQRLGEDVNEDPKNSEVSINRPEERARA